MKARAGDRIVLAASHVGEPTRDGRVVETRGDDGGPPFVVEWSDGHTGLIFPGPGAVLRVSTMDDPVPTGAEPVSAGAGPVSAAEQTVTASDQTGTAAAQTATAAGQPATPADDPVPVSAEQAPAVRSGGTLPHVRDWTVRITIFEGGDDTSAQAVLVADAPDHLRALGESHRSARDRMSPEIGDEVAVARALRHLADQLMTVAEDDIAAATGEDAYVRRS
ncbi:dsRBD fold-containing protein [Ornithinimicrobium cerasi]|uniref:dsRBD fold-containing protein n=1 Tax=Ornithinimicrobium cerasi TaxID=2248773 RepID=UPI00192A6536|nr:dsRBD fold-containing protein [Ornithinimicrobium cerasi]